MVFLKLEEYGAALKALCEDKPKSSCAALFALQRFFHGINFPLDDKGHAKLSVTFFTLSQLEIFHDDGFGQWREDNRNATPGHDAALAQTEKFFDWLEEEEDEEEEEEEEEEMAGVVKPMNKASLR